MPTQQLTERQLEILKLQEQGMKASQIAKKLGITVNGVYQHQRRIRDAGGSNSKPAASKSTKAPTPSPDENIASGVGVAVLPEAAMKARRSVLEDTIKANEQELKDAERVAAQTRDRVQKTNLGLTKELDQIRSAERVLKGTAIASAKPKSKPKPKAAPRTAPKKPDLKPVPGSGGAVA